MMMASTKLIACTALAAVLLMAGPAMADPSVSEIRVVGIVPTTCNVSFSNPSRVTSTGAIELGTMARHCNDGDGYRVVLRHPTGLHNAVFVHGATRVPLSTSGETVIVDSNTAEWSDDSARIESAAPLPENFTLGLSTQPKGAVY
jgi:hypothetical protein